MQHAPIYFRKSELKSFFTDAERVGDFVLTPEEFDAAWVIAAGEGRPLGAKFSRSDFQRAVKAVVGGA